MEEKLEHEMLKYALKMCVINNQQLNDNQKQQAINRIDIAAMEADWVQLMLRRSGYIQ